MFWRRRKKRTVSILSIDGGGIRGIIPITVLLALQRELARFDIDDPLHTCFDLIAGTSTGGLISLGLAAPAEPAGTDPESGRSSPLLPAMTLEYILSLYEQRSKEIFSKGSLGQLRSLGQMFLEKYDEESLVRLLQEVFGTLSMSDAMVPLAITSYECLHGEPFLFTSYDPAPYLMWEVGRATTAAPSYFPPAFINSPRTGKKLCFIDGGVAANNPALYGYLEARRLYPEAEQFSIFSIGTAGSRFSLPLQGLQRMGLIDWISPSKGVPLFHVYTSGQYHTAERVLNTLPDVQYYRIAGNTGDRSIPMDDVSSSNIMKLKRVANYICETHLEVIREYCRSVILPRK